MLTLRRQTIDRPAAALEERARRRGLVAKRAFDIVFGTLAALIATPVIIVLAIAMAVSLRTWPFFVQKRVGIHGRLFWFPKIRTLPPHTPKYTNKYTFDLDGVPRLARFMRRSHLDELPQLYLVPIGRMSLVGPRPKMPDSAEPIEASYGELRIQVRQGCSGLWQIGIHGHLQVSESPAYDIFYLRHGSIRMDLWILCRTVLQIFGAAPARLDGIPAWTIGDGLLTTVHDSVDLTGAEVHDLATAASR